MSSRASTKAPTGPREIGGYDVIRKLATGGMGEIHLARQRGPVNFSREVVLKRLHPAYWDDPGMVAMFLNEARIAATLSHPNIVHIYDLFEDDTGGFVIAMEYVRGGTVLGLLKAARGEPLPYGPAIQVAVAVCDGLHHAYHSRDDAGQPRGIIHRDVSLSNILVGYDGQVKLADFGVAKVRNLEMTEGSTVKGKYGYMSPEQVRCEPLDERSDLFSLGVVLWEMTVGRRLFKRDNEIQAVYAVVEDAIPTPSSLIADYPPGLEEIVMRALARDRTARYPDARAFANDLRRLARAYDWELEGVELGKLANARLPADQIAFAGVESSVSPRATRTPRPGPGLGVPISAVTDGGGSAAYHAVERSGGDKRDLWIAIAVMLFLSAVFWIWVVPRIM